MPLCAHIQRVQALSDQAPSEEDLAGWAEAVRSGLEAERKVIAYHDWLVATEHPEPPADAHERQRMRETQYDPASGPHPCTVSPASWRGEAEATDAEYVKKLNACERHLCTTSYCKKGCADNNCR
jgi:hypothetical protein